MSVLEKILDCVEYADKKLKPLRMYLKARVETRHWEKYEGIPNTEY